MPSASPHHWLIAGVGRSGTSAVYGGLQQCTHQLGERFKFFYEPYLWGPPTWTDPFADAAGAFASTSAMDPRGLRTHLATPLFISPQAPRNPAHEIFIKRVFPDTSSSLVKIIRGCGRLRDYLVLRPSLKVVFVIRNPLDCINSALERFSFYGDEFHPSDRVRFLQELSLTPRATPGSESAMAALWWSEMNKAALRTLAGFPGRALVLPYEAFKADREGSLSQMAEFLGPAVEVREIDLKRPAGPVSRRRTLCQDDVAALTPYHEWYFSVVDKVSGVSATASVESTAGDVFQRYKGAPPGAFKPEIPRDLSPTRLRTIILTQARRLETQTRRYRNAVQLLKADLGAEFSESALEDPFEASDASSTPEPPHADNAAEVDRGRDRTLSAAGSESNFRTRLGMESATALRAAADGRRAAMATLAKASSANVTVVRNAPALGCVVTSFNNGPALRRAVESVLAQALPPTEILIADDGSDADSRALAVSLEDAERNVKVVLRDKNLGPGLNRDLAIRNLRSAHFTTIDGDDEFAPMKLASEWQVLEERTDRIAFSDIAVIKPAAPPAIMPTGSFCDLVDRTSQFDAILNRTQWIPHNMLYARDLYLRAGGYDHVARLYEDWSLKIRLAGATESWRHADAIGLIYHRHGLGLSSASGIFHSFWKLRAIHANLPVIREHAAETRIIDALESALKAHSDGRWRAEAIAILTNAVAKAGPTAVLDGLSSTCFAGADRFAPETTLQQHLTDWIDRVAHIVGRKPAAAGN